MGRVPSSVHDDDGGYAAAAYTFWQTGKPGIPGYRDVVGLGHDIWAFGRIAAAAQGVFLYLGGVSVSAARLPSFILGVCLLVAVWLLCRSLWDRDTAVVAVLLLAASGKFFSACRWVRPDMFLAFLLVLSLWIIVSERMSGRFAAGLLSGLVMGLSGDVHLNGFILLPVPLLFALLVRRGSIVTGTRLISGYAVGAGVGVVFWLALHYFPDPGLLSRQWPVFGGSTHGVRFVRYGLRGAFLREIGRYTEWFWHARGHRHLPEGLCIASSGLWLIMRGDRKERALVYAWLVCFVVSACFMSNPFGWYLILVWPIFCIWMARTYMTFSRSALSHGVLAVLLCSYFVNLGLWHYKAWRDPPAQSAFTELRNVVPRDVSVLGSGKFWFSFWDRDFTDSMYINLRRSAVRLLPETGRTGWQEEQAHCGWRYIVASGDLASALDDRVPIDRAIAQSPLTPAREVRAVRAFSLARCSEVHRIDRHDGPIIVMRVEQDGSRPAPR